ncbi:efflux RND transporter permease subunit [Alteromonas halophila]|uniref:Cation transporter n=1 Tax=Alteromonas halophila TaxID=516698 RepID=A0A918JKB1_9ALTE|nr:efflux RND transporter permease subunit [Alteromonas halophila]GGW84707.1 cation transporter [Alteromonas halophila]
MIEAVIAWSLRQRFLVVMATLVLIAAGVYSLKQTPVDAIPDLSDVQVIVKTSYPGQAPQVVQDQVTYPLTTALLSVPGAQTVRGFSYFGDSYVYVIFDDDTDMYWARSRVLEYLNQVSGSLPDSVRPQLGPDATGVGWVYMYALVDKSGQHDLSELRSLQDWFLQYELKALEGVSEVASVGGMVRQYQVEADPDKLRAYNIPLQHVSQALKRNNRESGASVIEMAEAEYMVTASGYIEGIDDIRAISLGTTDKGVAVTIGDIARVQIGPAPRRGVAELNGEGEVTGGIVVMRYGENAKATIDRVKAKLEELKAGLPDGVELVTVYDRSGLIQDAIDNLSDKLLEEIIIVALVCMVFLFHVRSALVAIISLPVGILGAFLIMYMQGINANIMSLGGIAIAIGAMVDGAIVMVENLHKHMERTPITRENRWQVVGQAAAEVGPALFFSLLIITVSFLPVFTLEAQEGRLFSPLAFTKTYAMAVSAGLAITLVPVLMGYLVRGKIRSEQQNPLNRVLVGAFRPVLSCCLSYPKTTLLAALLLTVAGIYPYSKLGSEFMPPMDEGDLMYMPTTFPGVSIGKARELLQQTDKLIRTLPEVKTVFGKVGRADTATDPAPLTMIETFIQLKPRSAWRPGMTVDKLKAELDEVVSFPGLTNAWVMPIKTRIDMLATGIKTPVGIKIAGPDLKVIDKLGSNIERILGELPGTASVYAERVAGGRYLDIDVDRARAARYGMAIDDIHTVVSSAVGGMNVTQTIEGLERYPVNVRYPQQYRDSPEALRKLPLITPDGAQITLGDVASIRVTGGPAGIKSENARLNGWVLVDINDSDIGEYVDNARQAVRDGLELPPSYSVTWAGQYEYMQRASERLSLVVPLTLTIIVILLYLNFRRVSDVLIILGTLPFAITGGLWLLYAMNMNLSVAVGVGFIALAGVAVEIGVIMLVYLQHAVRDAAAQADGAPDLRNLKDTIVDGAARRVRPILMTAVSIIAGLLPVLFSTGKGAEVMSRIAAPMVGGMVSAMLLTLIVLPVVYYLWQQQRLK